MGAGTVPDKILNPEHAVLLVRGVKSSSHQANKEDSKKACSTGPTWAKSRGRKSSGSGSISLLYV